MNKSVGFVTCTAAFETESLVGSIHETIQAMNVGSMAVEDVSRKSSISYRSRNVEGGYVSTGLDNLISLGGLKVVGYIFNWILEELLSLALVIMEETIIMTNIF